MSALGMKPVVLKRFARGFIVNRIQRAINQELFQLLDEGVADAAALDDAVSVCLGARLAVMGYLSRLDFTGLDLVLSNYRQVPMGLATDETPPPCWNGWLGKGVWGSKAEGILRLLGRHVRRGAAPPGRGRWPCSGAETINARFPSPTLEPANGGAWQNGPSSQKDEDT
ncbi:MAG: 3-hydroxyacyl-CoA dehydrogenase family protein [Bilophila wadsworthia]